MDRDARATEASSDVVDRAHENGQSDPGTSRDGAINWSIILLLLGTLLVPVTVLILMTATDEGRPPDWPTSVSSSQETVITLEEPNYDKLIRKNLESVEGVAPRYSELAIYLNDELLDIVQADFGGRFSTEKHALPERSSRLVALPTEIDPSTLTILYLQHGFKEQWVVGRPAEPDVPFLASIAVHDNTLHAYGSTEPDSEVEICQGPCEGESVILTARSDKEGSFRAEPSSVYAPTGTLASLFARVRYIEGETWFDSSPLEPVTVELSPTIASPPIFQRAISVTLSPTSADLVFEVQMPVGYKVYQNLVKGDISELEFVEYIFGEVSVNTFLDPRQLVWRQEKSQQSQRVRVLIESNPLPYLIPGDTATIFMINAHDLLRWGIPFYNARDRIVVTLKDAELLQSNLLPTESTEDRVVWVGALTESSTILSLWTSRSPQAVAHPIHRFRLLNELTALLEDIVQKRVPGPIGETYEGLVVGLLPDRAPNPVRAQAYDFFRALYLADPLVDQGDTADSFHTFLRDLPGRVPEATENVLFGALWLIPPFLLLWSVRAPQKESGFSDSDRDRWVFIGWGTAILVFLCLDWWPFLERLPELSRHDFIRWLFTVLAMFLLLSTARSGLGAWRDVASGVLWSVPDKTKHPASSQEGKKQTNGRLPWICEWRRRICERRRIFTVALLGLLLVALVPLTRLLTLRLDSLLPLPTGAWASILLTVVSLLSLTTLAYLATRIGKDLSPGLRKTLMWLRRVSMVVPSALLLVALVMLTGLLTLSLDALLPLLPDAWGSTLLTALLLLSFATLAYLATRIGKDESQRLREILRWLPMGILIIALLSIPVQALSLDAQLARSKGVATLDLPRPLPPLLPDAWVSILLTTVFLLSFATLAFLATRIGKDRSPRLREILVWLLMDILVITLLSIPIKALSMHAQLPGNSGVVSSALDLLRLLPPLLPDAWVSILLTAVLSLSFATLACLATRIGKDKSPRLREILMWLLMGILVITLLSIPVQTLSLDAQLLGSLGVDSSALDRLHQPLPLMPNAWVSILLTALLLSVAIVVYLATRIGKDRSPRLREILVWVFMGILVITLLSIPIQALSMHAQLPDNSGVVSSALDPLRPLLPLGPDVWVLILLIALLLSFAVLVYLVTRIDKDESPRLREILLWLFVGILALALLSIPIQALSMHAQLPGSSGVVSSALDLLRPLLPEVVLLGLAMALRHLGGRKNWQDLTCSECRLGKVLFVVFAVGLSPSWSFIPVSLILSWFLYDRIVRDRPELDEQAKAFSREKRVKAIDTWLALNRQRRLRRAPEDDRQKQPRDDKADDSEKKATAHEKGFTVRGLTNCFMNLIISDRRKGKHQASASEPHDVDDQTNIPSDLAFGFGVGETCWDNARQALSWGGPFLVPLLLIHGWPLFTAEIGSVLPFPFLAFGVRLSVFAGQYLAMALYLGYFFPNIRGHNGLEKGALVAGCVILASLPVRLILASSSPDLVALLVWAGTVLSFNLLMGLIFDLKTLFHFRYGWHRRTDLYRFGHVAGLLIGTGAPFVTTVVTAVMGGLDKLVPAILKAAFPAVTLSEVQSELLQVLLDLAKRIAGT